MGSEMDPAQPENGSAWVGLGAAYLKLERYDDAIDATRQALHIIPITPWPGPSSGPPTSTSSDMTRPSMPPSALHINPEDALVWYGPRVRLLQPQSQR